MKPPYVVEIQDGVYVILERMFALNEAKQINVEWTAHPCCFVINQSEAEQYVQEWNESMKQYLREHPPTHDFVDPDGKRNDQIDFYFWEWIERRVYEEEN